MSCKICCHASRDKIETDISDGILSARKISIKYKNAFSRNVVGTHKNVCMLSSGDDRVEEARENAVQKNVDQFQGMTLIPTKWTRLEDEYEAMLKEAQEGPDFNDEVLRAVDQLTNGDRDEATKILISLGKSLAGDRKDRRDTLKEMRSLYDNQIQAMSRLEELRNSSQKREPIRIIYEVVA